MIYVSQIQFSIVMKDYIDRAAAGLDTIQISLGFNVCISINVCALINVWNSLQRQMQGNFLNEAKIDNYEDANRKKDNQ